MKVDRERFLLLVSALAAACRPASTPRGDHDTAAIAQIPAPPPLPPAEAPAGPVRRPERPGILGEVWGGDEGDEADEDAVPQAIEGGEPNPYSGTKVEGQTCSPSLNARGAPRACSALQRPPGPTCESFADSKNECAQLARRMQPRVAEKAVECLLAKSGSRDICVFNIPAICAYQALASVCVEPAAKKVCDAVVAACRGQGWSKMSHESCEAGFSAMKPALRPAFVACMTESCGFESCLAFF